MPPEGSHATWRLIRSQGAHTLSIQSRDSRHLGAHAIQGLTHCPVQGLTCHPFRFSPFPMLHCYPYPWFLFCLLPTIFYDIPHLGRYRDIQADSPRSGIPSRLCGEHGYPKCPEMLLAASGTFAFSHSKRPGLWVILVVVGIVCVPEGYHKSHRPSLITVVQWQCGSATEDLHSQSF